MLKHTVEDTARRMVESLRNAARLRGVSLDGLTLDNFNTFLDSAFMDGGEVRCEQFGDLAFPYALQFGQIESSAFERARWKCFERAFELLAKGDGERGRTNV